MGKYRSPITGYNHNVRHRGWVFHVQTEDSGVQNPHIFTHCFNGGVIVNTKKMVYDSIADTEIVKGLMQAQHKSVLRELKKGLYDEKIDRYLGAAPDDGEQGAEGPVAGGPVPLPPGAMLDASPELALGTPLPDILSSLEAEAEADVPPTEPLQIIPEHVGAPAQFPDTDAVPQPVDDELTAASTQEMTIDADAPEGLEARVAGLPGMPSVEPGRWQIREPARADLPPVGPTPVPNPSTWVVRAGGYQESPFEQKSGRVDEERAAATTRAPLTQPRHPTSIPQPTVTFTTPGQQANASQQAGAGQHARVNPRPVARPDDPPSGTFTINNRARKSISADMMGPDQTLPPVSPRTGSSAPPPWESQSSNVASRFEPRSSTNSGGGAPAIRPTGARPTAGEPVVRPAHPSATPGHRPSPPPTAQNVIVSRPVVLGQRDQATLVPGAHPHAVRVPPHRPTMPHVSAQSNAQPNAPSTVVGEKSLDEVILAYLSEEQKK